MSMSWFFSNDPRSLWHVSIFGGRVEEFDVVVSDFALTVLCAVCCWKLREYFGSRKDSRRSQGAAAAGEPLWLFLFFASGAVATLVGGIVHGFYATAEESFPFQVCWSLTMILVGTIALASYLTSFQVLFSRTLSQRLSMAIVLLFVLYCWAVLFYSKEFLLAIIFYAPAAFMFMLSYLFTFAQTRDVRALCGAFALFCTLSASVLQQLKFQLHPVYFTFNTTYHLIQFFGFILTFVGAVQRLEDPRVYGGDRTVLRPAGPAAAGKIASHKSD